MSDFAPEPKIASAQAEKSKWLSGPDGNFSGRATTIWCWNGCHFTPGCTTTTRR
jgi:hypothetical protein